MSELHRLLKSYFGYDAFRPAQEEIVRSVLAGQDVLALLPTGGGKSICYQLPAVLKKGVTLVVSPLIALMQDQVRQLKQKGILAAAVHSGLRDKEIDARLDNCIYGSVKLLYLSPERLQTRLFQERVKKMDVRLLAVDEAHCISEWGHDFRPPYRKIGEFREETLGKEVSCIALTATATARVQADIQEQLRMVNPQAFRRSFTRENLSYSAFEVEDKLGKLREVLAGVEKASSGSGSGIVYVRSRKESVQVAAALQSLGFSVDHYHAGLEPSVRSLKQEAWTVGKVRYIVATNAFGMGIDKPDVRVVAHCDLPDNIEAYYQEAGRAGRDDARAYAVLIRHPGDSKELSEKAVAAYPEVEFIRRVYQSLANYCQLAVGAAAETGFDFDLSAFCETYSLEPVNTHHALGRLQEQGFIQLSDAYHSPSRVQIVVSNFQLYETQVKYPHFDRLVKALLRMYGGGDLFDRAVEISESNVGRSLKVRKSEIVKWLRELRKGGIIEYREQKRLPQVVFIGPRYAAEKLPIDRKLVDNRRRLKSEQAQAVIDYARQNNRCRQHILLEYFGEEPGERCGICDYCLAQKRKQRPNRHDYRYDLRVIDELERESADVRAIQERVAPENREAFLKAVRDLLAAEVVYYDPDGRLALRKPPK